MPSSDFIGQLQVIFFRLSSFCLLFWAVNVGLFESTISVEMLSTSSLLWDFWILRALITALYRPGLLVFLLRNDCGLYIFWKRECVLNKGVKVYLLSMTHLALLVELHHMEKKHLSPLIDIQNVWNGLALFSITLLNIQIVHALLMSSVNRCCHDVISCSSKLINHLTFIAQKICSK